MKKIIIKATIDDLNQFLNGNVTKSGIIETLQDTVEFLQTKNEVK